MTGDELLPHLLVIDDDERLCDLLRRYLSRNGFWVSTAGTAEDGRNALNGLAFDLLIVDVMMPGQSGLEFTRALRGSGAHVPILLLTAMAETQDRIAGLSAGADDYLPKPFEPQELLLRVQSILRRAQSEPPEAGPDRSAPIRFGRYEFDRRRDLLLCAGEPVKLSSAEAALLRTLAAAPGEAVSREDLAARGNLDAGPRAIDVQVTRLRRKIEPDPKVPRYLQTVRGTGYVLHPD